MPSSDEAAISCCTEGYALVTTGDLKGATHFFKEAVKIDPTFGEAFVNLGACLGDQGLWSEAADAHRRALELMPDCHEASRNLGVALGVLEDYDASVTQFRHALRLRPEDVDTQMQLGYTLAQRSDGPCAEALQIFESVMRTSPENVDAYIHAARELVYFERRKEALATLKKALSIDPQAFVGWQGAEQLWQSLQDD